MNITAKLLMAAAVGAALSTGAMAADLGRPMKAAPMMMAPVASSGWDGVYVGANVGYAWGTATDTTNSANTGKTTGWLAGAQLGYNLHVSDSIVLGVQGDIDWTNETGTAVNVTATEKWGGAVVARAGVDLGQWMPYVEAGVAFANADGGPTGGPTQNHTYTGWTVGAGVQVMLAQSLSADLEYRYNNYGNQSYFGTPVSFNDSQVRVGLNYHF